MSKAASWWDREGYGGPRDVTSLSLSLGQVGLTPSPTGKKINKERLITRDECKSAPNDEGRTAPERVTRDSTAG